MMYNSLATTTSRASWSSCCGELVSLICAQRLAGSNARLKGPSNMRIYRWEDPATLTSAVCNCNEGGWNRCRSRSRMADVRYTHRFANLRGRIYWDRCALKEVFRLTASSLRYT